MERSYIFNKDPQSALLWLLCHPYKQLYTEDLRYVSYSFGNTIEYEHDNEKEIISFEEFMNVFKKETLRDSVFNNS